MMYLELKDGTKIMFSEDYSSNGVHITIKQKVTDEQKVEIESKLKRDRDLLSLKFVN